MNRFLRKGLSFALLGTFLSGLVGNNIACARSTADVAGLHVSLPDAFGGIGYDLFSRKYISGDKLTVCLTPYYSKPMLEMDKRLSGGTLERYSFSGPRIDQLLSNLKTILKEASELNDCDEDKIRDLRSKYTDTAKKLGEIVAEYYYAEQDIKFRHRLASFAFIISAILLLLAVVIANIETNNSYESDPSGYLATVSNSAITN